MLDHGLDEVDSDRVQLMNRVLSAAFYALASFIITVVNKTVLTSYAFPSFQFLGLGQMSATILVLWVGRKIRVVQFSRLDMRVACRIWPLPIFYLGNMATGLGGTKELSLPMFTALRRFGVLITMIGERCVLGIIPSCRVLSSVIAMVFGALVAATNDLTFTWSGYMLVLLNDVFTAGSGVFMKKKLHSKMLGMYGLMYYNALFMIVPAALVAWYMGEIEDSLNYPHWSDTLFLIQFFVSCVMGFVLSYSIMLCTQFNSALTTSIIGCLKNILVTYLGMVIGGDYVYSWQNFVGLNISVLASVVYTYTTFKHELSAVYRSLCLSLR